MDLAVKFIIKNYLQNVVVDQSFLHYNMVFHKKVYARGMLEKNLVIIPYPSRFILRYRVSLWKISPNLPGTAYSREGIETSTLCLGPWQLSISFLGSSCPMHQPQAPFLKRAQRKLA